MGRKWNIRIGTRTTPRKQSAIKAAREGRMLQRHWDYVKPIYLNALYTSLRIIMPEAITHRDVRQFTEECIEDAFVRIKEFEESKYKFRTFLVHKIIFPNLSNYFRERQKQRDAIREYFESGDYEKKVTHDFRYYTLKAFMDDAMRELKKDNEVQYEVAIRHVYEGKSYGEIYDEIKEQYPLSLGAPDAVKKAYQRSLPKLKHYLREVFKRGKYVDKELPLQKWFIARLRAETTKKS